jgi:hypothetical protein
MAQEGERYEVNVLTKLPTPQNVKAEVVSGSPFQISVSWEAVSGTDYYDVYRNGNPINLWIIETSYYYDDGYKTPGEKYSYEIVARNNDGVESDRSALSNSVTFPITDTVSTSPFSIFSMTEGDGYYRITVPSSGYYSLTVNDGWGNASYYIYHLELWGWAEDGPYSGSTTIPLLSSDEVILVVCANWYYLEGEIVEQ